MMRKKIYGTGPIWHAINRVAGNGLTILDVGCGAGATGEELRRRGHTVYGLDRSAAAITLARNVLDRAATIDLDRCRTLPYRRHTFDRILLIDVLEHLRDPGHALRLVRPYLKDDGQLVLSVPNVANYKVRWHLLWGRFDERCAPILEDDSHIKFFTLASLRRLLAASGYSVRTVGSTAGIDLPFGGLHIAGVPVVQRIRESITHCWKTLFAFQFVIVSVKTDRPDEA